MKKLIYTFTGISLAFTLSAWNLPKEFLNSDLTPSVVSQPKPTKSTTPVDPNKALFKNGGIIVWEKDGHGLVVAENDLNPPEEGMTWSEAFKACDNLVLNGYSNWRLPTKDECDLMKSLCAKNIGHLRDPNGQPVVYYYWTSTEINTSYTNIYGFHNYTASGGVKSMNSCCGGKIFRVRAVREF